MNTQTRDDQSAEQTTFWRVAGATDATDCKNLSEELFNAGEKGEVEKCRELINSGADVNWRAGKKLWFRTVLMQAAKSGMTEVCRLYLDHGAKVNALTESHFTALILAARSGHMETCKLLLSKGANVNNQTMTQETALMWAAGHGHPDMCKLLLKAGAKMNLQDTYGFTALTRAARDGHFEPCCILLEAGADPTPVSTLGDKVWDAEQWARMNKHQSIVKLIKSYKVRRSLLRDGSDPPSYVTLNICGAVNAGKTTLIRNLQLSAFQRRRNQDQADTSKDMASRTAGIEVAIITVPGVGEFRKMDMAGHSWAFTSNEYFIGKRTSISLVLFDLTKMDSEVENDLFHHLGCLKARETKCGVLHYRPEVVLIATHADKMASDPQLRANAFFKMAMESFQAYMNFYPIVMVLDCRNPKSTEFCALRDCLNELRGKIIKNSERVPRLCAQLLPHIRALAKKKSSFPVISWKEFVKEVKVVNKTADEEGVRNIAFYLSEISEIVNDNSPELHDKVVLDVNWLTSHIFGIALAPANFPRSLRFDTVSGMVSKEDLQANFPECPFEQLIELFVRFEVCIPWDEQELLCDSYLFPSHLEQNRSNLDDVWPQFGISNEKLCAVGRIIECENPIDMIPHSFFPKFQIRLLRRFGHRSPVWSGGIKIADDTVEILVTLSSSLKAVNICVWAPKGCEERCYHALKFIEALRNGLLNEVSGGVEFVHKAMSIKMLHQKRFEGYSLNEVDQALKEKGPNARVVLECCGINEFALDVKCCGIRHYVHPFDHISHMKLQDRKDLAKLLDSDSQSNLIALSEHLGVRPFAVENDDMGPPGFTNVIPNSETDHFLSHCAVHTDLRGKQFTEALEWMNRFDASTIVDRWLLNINMEHQSLAMHMTRNESSFSETERHRTSEPLEHDASEPSSLLGSRHSVSGPTGSYSCPCPQHWSDLLENSPSHTFPRSARTSSDGNSTAVSCRYKQPHIASIPRSTSLPSEHSCAMESCHSSFERISCEESQSGLSNQIVPQPRSQRLFDPCQSCEQCTQNLHQQETEGPKPHGSVQETSKNTTNGNIESLPSDIQPSVKEGSGTDLSFPTIETGEPDEKSSFPLRSQLPELSSRLSLSWRPVAFELGFRTTELCHFEEASLLHVQARRMLDNWLSKNCCTFECKHCEEAILERLGEAFENAHRADLKDFVEHLRKI